MAAVTIKKFSQYRPHTASKEQSQNLNLELYVSELGPMSIDFTMYFAHWSCLLSEVDRGQR